MSRRAGRWGLVVALGLAAAGGTAQAARADVWSVGVAGASRVAAGTPRRPGAVVFRISRTGALGAAAVDYATHDGTAVSGSAHLAWPVDYPPTRGTARLRAGADHFDVTVPLIGDDVPEPDEAFSLRIGHVESGTPGGDRIAAATATATIGSGAPAPCTTVARAGDEDVPVSVGGANRSVRIHIPQGARRGEAMPVLVALHGYRADGAFMERYTGFSALADVHRFIVAYPTAVHGQWRFHTRDGYRVRNDVQLVRETLDLIERGFCADTRRMFAVGVSNGGGEAARLACDLSDRLDGVATLAGRYDQVPSCRPRRPVSLLEVHGLVDPVVPYGGFPSGGGSVLGFVGMWRRLDRCTGPAVRGSVGPGVSLLEWKRCGQGTILRHLALAGFAHVWPGTFPSGVPDAGSAAVELWRFFTSLAPREPLGGAEPGEA